MEERAFEQMARQWRQQALSVSRNCGAGEAEAEDIAQDVMLRLWQMHMELDRYRSVEALITVMAKRMTWSRLKSFPRPLQREGLTYGEQRSPQEILEEKENDEWLQQHLAELPPTQRTLLYMRQVERRSHKELSQLLGIEESSVSTLLARARRTLLEEIRRRG